MEAVATGNGNGKFDDYRSVLLQIREELRAKPNITPALRSGRERIGDEDLAPVAHEEFISLSLNAIHYRQLTLIEDALQRIESGEYGLCLSCGEPIGQKRLRAIPWAECCIECQELAKAG